MLREYCLDWISKHAYEVLDTDSFRTLSSSNPDLVVEILRVKADPTGPGMKRKRSHLEKKDRSLNYLLIFVMFQTKKKKNTASYSTNLKQRLKKK